MENFVTLDLLFNFRIKLGNIFEIQSLCSLIDFKNLIALNVDILRKEIIISVLFVNATRYLN